jgi:lysozyme
MKTSKAGIDLIKSFEGCKLTAYQDSGGIWTVGIGATFYPNGSKVKQGDTITQQQADEMLEAMLPQFEKKVLARVARPLKQNEFDAAVSFCYNAGTGYRTKEGVYKDFDLWKHINNHYEQIESYWKHLAVTAGGKQLNGLIRRRAAEVNLYLNG